MNIKGKIYPEVEVTRNKVPEFDQEVKVENGIIWTIIVNPDNGKKLWARVDYLKSAKESNEYILERLLWAMSDVKKNMDMSKAELKRRLIKYDLISK